MSLSSSSKLKYSARTCSAAADLKVYVREVSDKLGKKRPLIVRTWSTVKDVKDALSQLLHIPPSALRLYFATNVSNILTNASLGQELPNHRSLNDAGIYKNGETILYEVKSNQGTPMSSVAHANDISITSSLIDLAPRSLLKTVQLAKRGFARGIKPELSLDGTGGTYFLHDARKVKVAVFKPEDEEPYAENNPRGYGSTKETTSMRAGIKPGDACLREVAAYLLDHDGFCSVPATTLAEARHPNFHSNGSRLKVSEGGASIGTHSLGSSKEPSLDFTPISLRAPSSPILHKKVGSFQEYIDAECTMDDLSPSKLTVDEVHKIAILDIRLLNADRNAANLLVVRKFNDNTAQDDLTLVPIDHGYCLRAVADVAWFDWCWLEWAQLKQPLSEKTKNYVLKRINIEEDIKLLRDRLHLPQTALDHYRSSTKLLQEGVRAGMTLYDIAILCCRNDDSGVLPSKLEKLTIMASEIALSAVENSKWESARAKRSSFPHLSRSLTVKSASNVDFSSFNLVEVDSSVPTPLVPSSDSSSSDGDGDHGASLSDLLELGAMAKMEDASIVDDERCHQVEIRAESGLDNSCFNGSSCADDASYNLSTSPVGFWTIPPSSSKTSKAEKEVQWSPHLSGMKNGFVESWTLDTKSSTIDDVEPSGKLAEYYIKFVDLLIARLTATESSRRGKVQELDTNPSHKVGRSPSIESECGGFHWNGSNEL